MARFLIDANLPRRFDGWTSCDYVFVHDIDPTWSDRIVWDHALANDFIIVTRDADFTDRALLVVRAPKIIHMRLGNMRLREWRGLMASIWPDVVVAIADYRIVVVFRDTLDCIA